MPRSPRSVLSLCQPSRVRIHLLAAAICTFAVTGWAVASEAQQEAPAQVVLDSAALRFDLRAEADSWTLTVSGPESFYQRHEFSDKAPRIELVGADGALLADGPYSWELRATPPTAAGKSRDAAQWGHFIVRQGVAVLPEPAVEWPRGSAEALPGEGPAALAPTHGSDVYIDGHLCVGGGLVQDLCTGAESLALRTILMKDDNIRLRFEDASAPAGNFASTDWQLTANDSSNSGDDYFAVQDLGDTGVTAASPLRIDAGAGDNAIRVDGSGEVGLGTATPGARLHVMGDAIVEGDFTAGSSRDIKHAFEPVEPKQVLGRLLELPITEWSYRSGQPGIRHMGPVAEDFSAAFALGRDDRHVSPVDLSGVAFAAIQGLHEVVRERDAEIEGLHKSRDELAARLEALENLVHTREAQIEVAGVR